LLTGGIDGRHNHPVTPEQTAAATRPAVRELGGSFTEDPRTLRRARQLGLTGWAFYIAGRGGVLGDVDPDTLTAALGFVAADAVRDGWEAARRVVAPREVAAHHLAECCRWGREKLDDLPGATRLLQLGERVVAAADAGGLPLFAAWRTTPVPEDGPGARLAVMGRLLSEHRAGARLVAVRAAGLSPLESILAGPGGQAEAVAFGWQPPFPPSEPLLRKRVWADALADRISGEAYRTLTPAERAEMIELLDDAVRALRAPTGEYPRVR
jgi:hypothetical protein